MQYTTLETMLSAHVVLHCVTVRRLTQYAASKLCNILHTRELQDRYQQSRGIIATSCSPGFVNTTIFRQGLCSQSY
jgi:NAD(P)-dependent dehydrogenase (short-subunit alcohol dehydrogenase family)